MQGKCPLKHERIHPCLWGRARFKRVKSVIIASSLLKCRAQWDLSYLYCLLQFSFKENVCFPEQGLLPKEGMVGRSICWQHLGVMSSLPWPQHVAGLSWVPALPAAIPCPRALQGPGKHTLCPN